MLVILLNVSDKKEPINSLAFTLASRINVTTTRNVLLTPVIIRRDVSLPSNKATNVSNLVTKILIALLGEFPRNSKILVKRQSVILNSDLAKQSKEPSPANANLLMNVLSPKIAHNPNSELFAVLKV